MQVAILILASVLAQSAAQPDRSGGSAVPALTDSRSPAALSEDGVTPWLVFGDLVDAKRVLRRGTAGGTVVRTWDPPSLRDLEAYLEAVGVALGIDPVLNAAADTLLADFRTRLEAIDSKRMPEIFDRSEANNRAAKAGDNTVGMGLGDLLRAVQALQQDREQAEAQFLDGVDRLLDEIGFPPSDQSRAIRKSFEDARWRARGAQMAHMVASARCDLGLVAVETCGGPSASTLLAARAEIQGYWRDITVPSMNYVRLELELGPRGRDVRDRAVTSPNQVEQASLEVERAAIYRRIATALFQRTKLNIDWRSRIADRLPEPQRTAFLDEVQRRMFPKLPDTNTRGRADIREAIIMVEPEPDRVQVLQALLLRHDDKAKKIITKMEAVAINEDGAMYGLLDSGRKHWQAEQETLVRSLEELGESARSELRQHLTMEQVQRLDDQIAARAAAAAAAAAAAHGVPEP